MNKQIISVFLICLFSVAAVSQSRYSRVKIDLSKTDVNILTQLGLETDHGSLIRGVHFVNDFSEKEINLLESHGIEHHILIEDVQKEYKAKKNSSSERSNHCGDESLYNYTTPLNYTYGTMGGYHTYDEMYQVMEDMAEKYPHLITPIKKVGEIKTWEDNDIIWLRISDNPNIDEDEPEALFTALHHAREPNSLSQMIFYMWYLLENYETDPMVKYLVDNTEQYFMPCLNPDGYKYNETTDPTGGGFWRKNRRPEEDAEHVGVDLNRNYGYFWGFDNFGSSPNMESSTYRGPQAFSEPETQAVREMCLAHNFQIALNYHTHGNLLIHPWGYNDQPTDEDSLFKAMSVTMTKENKFTYGTGSETVGYVVNGDSDDYMYGEQAEKNGIYSFTPEVGTAFWPDSSEIDQLNKSCLLQNLNTANLLLNFYNVDVHGLLPIVSMSEGSFDIEVLKAGLRDGDATINLVSNNPEYLSFEEFVFPVSLPRTQTTRVPVVFHIAENTPSLQELSFDVLVHNGEFVYNYTYNFLYRNTIFEENLVDDFTDLNNWTTDQSTWGLTDEYFVSAPNALTDSPDGDYDDDRQDYVTLLENLDLQESDFTSLKFSARWEIEYNYDYAMVQISTDDWQSYESLCGNFTRPGAVSHGTNEPLYDGRQLDWVVEEMDLSAYQGEIISLRLAFVSDQAVTLDGFFIDDILIEYNSLVSVSTEDLLNPNLFEVMPSLNAGTFDVRLDEVLIQGGATVEVIDVGGKILYRKEVSEQNHTIRLINATNGIYAVKITDKDGKVASKKLNIIR